MEVFIDFETRASLDLKKVGAYRYVECPDFAPLLLSCAVDDGPIQVLEGDEILPFLRRHAGGTFVGWGNFDRVVLHRLRIPYGRYVDASICAAEYGWPLKLELAAVAADVPLRKDSRGQALIQKFSKPRRAKTGPRWNDKETHPEEWEHFRDYARVDTEVMRQIYRRCPPLREDEEALRLLDQRMNNRGIRVDLDGVRTLQALREQAIAKAHRIVEQVTNGVVKTASQVDALARWAGLPDLRAATVEAALMRDLRPEVREALLCRQIASKSSGSKLDAFLATVSRDGRCRGTAQFCGAHTRRWAGRGIQPQNFPRDAMGWEQVERLLEAAPEGPEAVQQKTLLSPTIAISQALRGMLLPSESHVLLVADYAAIEARLLAWYAGQLDALEIYRSGGDVYKAMAARVFGVPVEEVTKDQRFFGKTLVLGAGYMLGAGKLQAQLAGQGIDVPLETAQEYVTGYRTAYDRVARMWGLIKTAMIDAIENPGKVYGYWDDRASNPKPKLRFVCRDGILRITLADGMHLYYHGAKVEMVPAPWDSAQQIKAVMAMARTKAGWQRRTVSPGLATENVVQATARGLLKAAMLAMDARGLPPLLTIHDEIIAESRDPADLQVMVECMEAVPSWAAGLPLAVEATVMRRYGK